MKVATILAAAFAAVACADNTMSQSKQELARRKTEIQNARREVSMLNRRSAAPPTGPHGKKLKYYNHSTKDFWVNGTAGAIPDVDFDVSESYAGLLPISQDKNETRELYFWFFPTTGTNDDDIVIWLNGGPGCSSLEGFLQENGPFTWQYGTYKPVANPYTWVNLTNMIWVEQPVGTGFSRGTPDAASEEDVAREFLGFWHNFVNTFGLHNKKIYVTGESYAGMYVPYIADAMYAQKSKRTYGVNGIMIYDPSIAADVVLEQAPVVAFVEKNQPIFNLNDTYMADLKKRADSCGYTAALEQGLSYPPKGHLNLTSKMARQPGCDLWDDVFNAALWINPCFNEYHITDTCPLLWDVLGFPGSFEYTPAGAKIYFNRPEVQKAINAPLIEWSECSEGNVFVGRGDKSLPSSLTALPSVIDKSERTIIAHGLLDMVLIADGTRMAIQNMTFGGVQGFQTAPSTPFVVPYDGQGDLGVFHTERKLTYVEVKLSGHMVPQYQPGAAYRQLEFLLGRIASL